jgi:hypothetical protein
MKRPLALGALLLALVVGSPASGAPTSGAPVQISTGDRALGPELAVDPAGDAAVVWDQEVGPDCASSPASLTCAHIVELTSRKHGVPAWLQPVELGRPGIGDRPRVAINDGGDAVVAWVHDIGRDRVLQATFRSRSASAWPEPNDISAPSLGVQDFRIGLDSSGNAIAIWAERTEAGVALRIATRSVTAGGWGAARTLSRPGGNVSGGPSVALTPGGEIAVAWIEDGAIREVESVIGFGSVSGSWANPLQLSSSENGVASGTPDIAFDQTTGDTAVVWAFHTGSGTSGVGAAFHSFALGEWTEQNIGDLAPPFDSPRVGAGNGNAVAVWVNGFGIVSAAHTQPNAWSRATAWSSETLVSAQSSTVADPDIALDPHGNAVAVWTRGANAVVQSAIRPEASGEWQRPVAISGPGSSKPRVSLGATLGIWNRSSAPRIVVESSDLTGRGPVLERLRVPERTVVGAPARFSIIPVPWASPLASAPRWQFGDGASATGTSVTHTYRRSGGFTVVVSESDEAGETSASTAPLAVVAAPPRNGKRPTVRGAPKVRNTLTCLRGSWTGSPPIRYAYGWTRHGRPIPGATGRSYRLVPRDAGSLIACEVVATNPGGSARATSPAIGVHR